MWSSNSVTGFAILARPGGVLIGTSDKGRIYSVTDDGRILSCCNRPKGKSRRDRRGPDVFAASSNQGKLFRFGGSTVKEGSYESPVRDGKLVASWGKIWWRGAGPIELQTRSGNSEDQIQPGATGARLTATPTVLRSSVPKRALFNGARFSEQPPVLVCRSLNWKT